MRRPIYLLISLAFSGLAAAQGYQPDFDPGTLKGPAAGTPNEVLVLGSPHLSQLPASFDPATLQLLNDQLAGWRPQTIAIEALSGPQCEHSRRAGGAARPGIRMLVVVGASHKAYLEAYLRMTSASSMRRHCCVDVQRVMAILADA